MGRWIINRKYIKTKNSIVILPYIDPGTESPIIRNTIMYNNTIHFSDLYDIAKSTNIRKIHLVVYGLELNYSDYLKFHILGTYLSTYNKKLIIHMSRKQISSMVETASDPQFKDIHNMDSFTISKSKSDSFAFNNGCETYIFTSSDVLRTIELKGGKKYEKS